LILTFRRPVLSKGRLKTKNARKNKEQKMAVRLTEKSPSELLSIDGVQVYVGQAGVKKADRDDLTLIVLNSQNTVGAVFTQNRFCAAPVYIAKSHLFDEDGVRALVINTGNANAGTGAQRRAPPRRRAAPGP